MRMRVLTTLEVQSQVFIIAECIHENMNFRVVCTHVTISQGYIQKIYIYIKISLARQAWPVCKFSQDD